MSQVYVDHSLIPKMSIQSTRVLSRASTRHSLMNIGRNNAAGQRDRSLAQIQPQCNYERYSRGHFRHVPTTNVKTTQVFIVTCRTDQPTSSAPRCQTETATRMKMIMRTLDPVEEYLWAAHVRGHARSTCRHWPGVCMCNTLCIYTYVFLTPCAATYSCQAAREVGDAARACDDIKRTAYHVHDPDAYDFGPGRCLISPMVGLDSGPCSS